FISALAGIAHLRVWLQWLSLAAVQLERRFFTFRGSHRFGSPLAGNHLDVARPELAVVRQHEMLGNSPAKLSQDVLFKILCFPGLPRGFFQPLLTGAHNIRVWYTIVKTLKRIGDKGPVGVNACITL